MIAKYRLSGRVPPKKNSRRNFYNRHTGRYYSLPSALYESYKLQALYELKSQTIKKLKPPYKIKITFYMTGKATMADYDNMASSINDILQEAEIISDDRYIMEALIKKVPAKEYFTEIEIEEI